MMIMNYLHHRQIQPSIWFNDHPHHLFLHRVLLEKMKVIQVVQMYLIINYRSKQQYLQPINFSKNIVSMNFEHDNQFHLVMISQNVRVHHAFHRMSHLYDFSFPFFFSFVAFCSHHFLSLEMIRKRKNTYGQLSRSILSLLMMQFLMKWPFNFVQ